MLATGMLGYMLVGRRIPLAQTHILLNLESMVIRSGGADLEVRFKLQLWHKYRSNPFAEPPEIGHFSFSKPIMNEGDFAQLSCIVTSGDEPLSITWSFHGDRVGGSETGIDITNLGPRMSILVIGSVGHRHQGKYTCQAKNAAGVMTHTTELKVNG